jgi:hypothetical protein
MHRNPLIALAAIGVLGLAACSDSTEPTAQLVTDEVINADVAQAAGDAIALDVQNLIGAELQFGLPGSVPAVLGGPPGDPTLPPGVDVTRARTCYDADGAAQAQCDPLTTATMLLEMTMHGTFTRVHQRPAGSDTVTASIHRARTTEISGLLGQETFRVHDGVGTSHDTTLFTDGTRSRKVEESSVDSTIAIRFNLPRDLNPWPVSGTMVRRVSGQVTLTGPNGSGTRTFDRRVSVTFPADAQGNVPITINSTTCTLNLVTHRVVCP